MSYYRVTVENDKGHTREISPLEAKDATEAAWHALLQVKENCKRGALDPGYRETWGLVPQVWKVKHVRKES